MIICFFGGFLFMEKTCKRVSWISIVSIVVIVVGTIFGVLASLEFKDDDFLKYGLMSVAILLGIVLTISNVVSFISMRQGNVKSSILSLGKHTKIQGIAPFAIFIFGIIGVVNSPSESGDVNYGAIVFLIVTFVLVLFVFGFNANGLKAYRKDKETYLYIAITSFLTVLALIVFMIGAGVAMAGVPAAEGSHVVGYLETFAILFTVADTLAFLSLGIACVIGKKYAPKLTMADADAKKLDDISESINKLAQGGVQSNGGKSNVEQLREYKKLLDEGIITKEEFENKKKELL